MTDAIF